MRKVKLALALGLFSIAPALLADESDVAINNRLVELSGTIQSINEELSNQRANLGQLKAELANTNEENEEFKRSLVKELKALRRQNQTVFDSLFANNTLPTKDKQGNVMNIKPLTNYDIQTPDGKMIFGEDEFIYIKEANAIFDCRIDTGAAVSSISATNITEFERNAKKWYRFTIKTNDREIEVEAPFVRYSDVRQASKSTTTRRVVVSLNVKIGDYSNSTEFTLTDRTAMQYAVLIGRTLIQDIAVVDVARDHIQKKAESDVLLILNRDEYRELKKKGINPNADYDAKLKNKAGQIAYPSEAYGSNLGTNSDLALPEVSKKLSDKNNTN